MFTIGRRAHAMSFKRIAWILRSEPRVVCVLRVQVFTHAGNLACPTLHPKVVLLRVVAAVLEVCAPFRLDRDAFAFRDHARNLHVQRAIELVSHTLEQPLQVRLIVQPGGGHLLGLSRHEPGCVVGHLGQNALNVERVEPSQKLRANTIDVGAQYKRLPDGEVELVIRFGDGQTVGTLVGTRTVPLSKPASVGANSLLVRFRIGGGYAFFRPPMTAFTDQLSLLTDLWSERTRAEIERAQDADSVTRATLDALQLTLREASDREPASVPAIRRAVRVALDAPVLPRVQDLAVKVGMSERQLRRGFDDVVGIAPKRFLRIVRFRRALRAARVSARRDWAAIAESAGYYDQAHLIADFRELTGATPGALLESR
jgi:AraC-like DNA-binding protein